MFFVFIHKIKIIEFKGGMKPIDRNINENWNPKPKQQLKFVSEMFRIIAET
jgi:hypothetical protein